MNSLSFNSILFFIVKASLLLVFLNSLNAWFTWELHIVVINSIGIIAFTVFTVFNKNAYTINYNNLLLIVTLFAIKFYSVKSGNFNAFLNALISSTLIGFLICIKDNYKIEILHFITKLFAFVLLISLSAWILFLAGIPMPYSQTDFNEGMYNFHNYYFFLFGVDLNIFFVPRFMSVFLEPGYVGVVLVYLLFIHQLSFRKPFIIVIFISTLFTFSLAAYILLLFTIFSIILKNNIIKATMYFLLLLFVFVIVIIFITHYNSGENAINKFIIQRLVFENGNIAGYNRYSEFFEDYFESFIGSLNVFFGIGTEEFKNLNLGPGSQGYKRFMIQNGLVGVFACLFFYFLLALRYNTKHVYLLFILFTLSFLQAFYPLWEYNLILFITALPLMKSEVYNK